MFGTYYGAVTGIKTECVAAVNIKLDDKEIDLENVLAEWVISEFHDAKILVSESMYKQDA